MNNGHFDCVGLGICAVDYLCLLASYPQIDEKTVLQSFSKQGGGPTPTALVALARLGARTAYIGKVGHDEGGEFIARDLENEGVNTTFLIKDKTVRTPDAFIWIDSPSGKRTVVLNRTQMSDISLHEMSLKKVAAGKAFLIDGWEVEASIQAAQWARQAGKIVIADFGSLREKIEEMLYLVDYPIVSEKFMRQMWGEIAPGEAVNKLLKWGAKAAIITCGIRGCYGANANGMFHQPAFKVPVIDTTGAGDVFHGAAIYAILQGWTLPQLLRFASAVAALKCSALGGRAGIPKLPEVDAFLNQNLNYPVSI